MIFQTFCSHIWNVNKKIKLFMKVFIKESQKCISFLVIIINNGCYIALWYAYLQFIWMRENQIFVWTNEFYYYIILIYKSSSVSSAVSFIGSLLTVIHPLSISVAKQKTQKLLYMIIFALMFRILPIILISKWAVYEIIIRKISITFRASNTKKASFILWGE